MLTLVQQLNLEVTKSLHRPWNKSPIFHLCEAFHLEVLILLEITHQIILWPIPSIYVQFVETKHLASIMEFTHVRAAKDFSSVLSVKSCPMPVVKIRIVSLIKDSAIDVNTAGKLVHLHFGSLVISTFFKMLKVHEMLANGDEKRSCSRGAL